MTVPILSVWTHFNPLWRELYERNIEKKLRLNSSSEDYGSTTNPFFSSPRYILCTSMTSDLFGMLNIFANEPSRQRHLERWSFVRDQEYDYLRWKIVTLQSLLRTLYPCVYNWNSLEYTHWSVGPMCYGWKNRHRGPKDQRQRLVETK